MAPSLSLLAARPRETGFGFPALAPPRWRHSWQQVIKQVDIAHDNAARDIVFERVLRGHNVRTIGFVNAHALNRCVRDHKFVADLLHVDCLLRDGIGVQTLYRLAGAHAGLNLNGTDLLPELMARFGGQRIAFYGTTAERVEAAATNWRTVVDCDITVSDGFQPDGYYLERAARDRPALIILGMGMPKQERVARLMKQTLDQDVVVVCGGAVLDFLSGQFPRAPLWVRKMGLEWAFRLSLEPKRLFGRYVIGNPLFLVRSALLAAMRGPWLARRPVEPPREAPAPRPPARPELRLLVSDRIIDTVAQTPADLAPLPAINGDALARMRAGLHAQGDALLHGAAPVLANDLPGPQSPFSANRPVVVREDLFGRAADLEQLLTRVLDQNGNALIYGPRGYGKTSLVRVFGEISDSFGHVVIYASCAKSVDFSTLMRTYLDEIPFSEARGGVVPFRPRAGNEPVALSVADVANMLASVTGMSLVFILDEFDRIERNDTREQIVDLIKDLSDLGAPVRFLLVGVATDAAQILGYHPSVHRCISCVPLARLEPDAVAALFREKAAADQLAVDADVVATVVALTAGSAYHAQLIGQKMVARVGRAPTAAVNASVLDDVIAEVVADAVRIDPSLAGLAATFASGDAARETLMMFARAALGDRDDIVRPAALAHLPTPALFDDLCSVGVVQPIRQPGTVPPAGYRFTNAFTPQLLLMLDHLHRRPRLN